MPPKKSRSTTNLPMNKTTDITNIWRSRIFLAPNEYSSATIGIHNYLVRCYESEHFARSFYEGMIAGFRTKDFIHLLSKMEEKLKDDCQLNCERCPMVTRLRRYLEKNGDLFEYILDQIKDHLRQSMQEDPPPEIPQTYDEFTQQCIQRNQAAFEHDKVDRMRRFQFYDNNEVNQPVNLINLQIWTQSHFQLLVENITPNVPNRAQLVTDLQNLLDNSFFIIEHPSPRVVTHSPLKNESATANVNCRLLWLLDASNPAITIKDIIPYVYCLTKSDQMEENDVAYRQSQLEWDTYSIVTASNNRKRFSCADLSKIILNQMCAEPQRQQSSTGKKHYAPLMYRIDFHIDVTVCFPNDPSLCKHHVIVQSAPFGLITNTCQEEELFAKVFIEDLRCLKSISTSPLPLISNTITSEVTPVNLTITDIVDSIRRYFIHKTGIQPKQWIMPCIEKELSAIYNGDQNSMDDHFYDILAKILAQIDYMAKHPLLTLFHDDGLFLGICDSILVDKILSMGHERWKKPVCAIRFGSIHRMSNAKDVGVRVNLVDNSSNNIKHCTFDTVKLPLELGSFITKIVLYEAACFENILSSIIEYAPQQFQVTFTNMRVSVDLYYSKKLQELCPPERYSSILTNFNSKENEKPKDSSSSPIPTMPQNFTMTITTGASANTHTYRPYNTNIYEINQEQQVVQPLQPQYLQWPQYSQIPQYFPEQQYLQSFQSQPQHYPQSQVPLQVQSSYASFSNLPQVSMAPSYISQNNQQYITSAPVVIVITSANQFTMSNHDIAQLISVHLPQYAPSIRFDRIHHIDSKLLPQPSNAPLQTLQNSIPNLQSTSVVSEQSIIFETYTTDSSNFP